MMRLIRPVLALAIASCFSPTYPAGAACGPNGECPPGQRCGVDDRCRPDDASDEDAGGGDAEPAPIDASAADACGVPESCNALDDDCDMMIDEDWPLLGSGCDGVDSDLCDEGFWECNAAGDGLACDDTTGDDVETCNGLDDDCDGTIDDGFDLSSDVAHCGACDNACVNAHGSTTCLGGACSPECSSGAVDCNGDPDDGCELRNTDPMCMTGTVIDLGTLIGDAASSPVTTSGYGEGWFTFRLDETTPTLTTPITARVELASPPGVDFDLYVRCFSCGGTEVGFSALGAGQTDTVDVGRNDTFGDNDYDVSIEVRFASATACGDWTLTITGGVNTSNRVCE